jgi:hypothetical protein
MTLACALLLANAGQPAGQPEPDYLKESQFQIPISIAPERRGDIKELLLYLSTDNGQTFSLVARTTPDKTGFPYYAANDGVYWFAIAILDRQNHQEPIDVAQSGSKRCIIVDTRKPDIRVTRAEQRDGVVQVQWDIREEYPDPATFRLEYHTADGPGAQWTPVNVAPALQGETSFRLAGTGAVQVRILLSDRAGNIGQAVKDIPAAAGPAVVAAQAGPGTAPNFVPPPPGAEESPNPSQQVAPSPPGGDYRTLPSPESVAKGTNHPWEESSRTPVTYPIPVTPPPQQPVQPPQPTQGQSAMLAQSDSNRYPIQQTSAPGERISSGVAYSGTGYAGVRGNLPPVEIVNKTQPKLDFQVGKYGPSGLGAVDVWVTTDDGATWALLSPSERTVTLPTLTDARSSTPVPASVTVDLKKEGIVYGYYIVVKSKAGLGKKPPEPGTAPQVRLEMDITPPSVELYSPGPDGGRTDTLILSWKASDKNLPPNCVTIEWAEQKDGQWKVIGTPDMPNTGRYPWQVPANVPPAVFLRVAVRDTAGNVAVAQTDSPVVVDLSTPEVGPVKVNTTR